MARYRLERPMFHAGVYYPRHAEVDIPEEDAPTTAVCIDVVHEQPLVDQLANPATPDPTTMSAMANAEPTLPGIDLPKAKGK